MLVFAIVSILVAVYFLYQVIGNVSSLNKKTPLLLQLDAYDTRTITNNPLTESTAKNMDTLQDMIDQNVSTQKDIRIYSKYLAELQIPYTYFLQYVYLPSLNIWKDIYTKQISIDLIGMKFLQKNPYDDIKLLQKRSDFFKSVGDNNESNDIKNIDIGDIKEEANGYFTIPITVDFLANSKRAFLLLVDKISVTSNKTNISLINEFWYYLWQEIKKDKQKEIATLTTKYASLTGLNATKDQDKVIAYNIYNWIYNDKENALIDKSVIDKTIKNIISCEGKSDEVCYYQFRDKYKNIPSFGYFIGTDFTSDPAQNFKKFMLNLPPIFSLKSFTFNKEKPASYSDTTTAKYAGTIRIDVYGRGISQGEIDEISEVLGESCFKEKTKLSLEKAQEVVSLTTTKLSNLERIDKSQSDNLREIKNTLSEIKKTYEGISPYKKTIKLFEIFRTLQDGGLCK
ncbi:MAG: hypothetical protein WCJ39_07690 [bacterium]